MVRDGGDGGRHNPGGWLGAGATERCKRTSTQSTTAGEFTPQERARIQRQLDRESQNIYQQKHDAQDRNPNNGINERQQNQRERIQQGVRSGELTPVEAARIRRQEAQIRLNEARARQSGGEFTPQERARIQRQLNRESRRIYRQKHDAQDRNP